MNQRVVPALMAAVLLAAPARAEPLDTDDPEHPAHVGPWRVTCDHDGNLHGRNFEACAGWVDLKGGKLGLTRLPHVMTVEVLIRGCTDFTGSVELDVKRMTPGAPGRVEALTKAIRQSAATAARACHRAGPSVERALVPADLEKVLKLTDGLEDFGEGL